MANGDVSWRFKTERSAGDSKIANHSRGRPAKANRSGDVSRWR